MTIRALINAIVSIVKSWTNPANLDADLIFAISELNKLGQLVNAPIVGAAKNLVVAFEANVHNLDAGQAVIVASTELDGKKYKLALFEEGGPAAQSLGL